MISRRREHISIRKLDETQALFPSERPLVLAVSGGVDSMVLLHAAANIARPGGWIVAHFDHLLRDESSADAQFVQDQCRTLGFQCIIGQPEQRYSQSTDGNLENWARHERYKFLASVADQHNAAAVFTAHHLRDQAETVLFRFITGRDALGIRERWVEDAVEFVRPFLTVDKESLDEAAAEWQVTWVEDQTNSDLVRSRNFIRHEILPRLKSLNPALERTLLDFAKRRAEDEAFLSAEAGAWLERHTFDPSWKALRECPPALVRRVLRALAVVQLQEPSFHGRLQDLSRIAERIRQNQTESGLIELNDGVRCRVGRIDGVKFYRVKEESSGLLDEGSQVLSLEQPVPGEVLLSHPSLSTCYRALCLTDVRESLSSRANGECERSAELFLDPSKKYFWRFPLPGDALNVPRRGTRKLKKLFQESGIPAGSRGNVLVLACGESSPTKELQKLVWVPEIGREVGSDQGDRSGVRCWVRLLEI